MKTLFIGDIVARPGRNAVTKVLPKILESDKIDLVIANADNIAHGRGATAKIIKEMQEVGVNYFTGGDHIFWHKGFGEDIGGLPVVRPANYPEGVLGRGHTLIDVGDDDKVLLINVMGRTFLNERLDDPFTKVDEILDFHKDKNINTTIVDFHAEATSEKTALGFYLDGKVTAVVGTHTHVPTCDNRVLPKGTLYVSDIGMTGVTDSVLGVKSDIIIDLYTTGQRQKFEWEDSGRLEFRSVLIDTEACTIDRLDREV